MQKKKKLTIGFVLDDSLDKPDGVQQYVLGLGEWLRSQGHDVHYIVSNTKRTDLKNIHVVGKNVKVKFNHNTVGTPLPASRSNIRQLFNSVEFDVLHVQMPYSPFLAQRVITAAPQYTAVIGTFHILPFSTFERYASKTLKTIISKSLRRFDKVVSVSKPAANFALEVFGLDSEVLPNVVDTERFASAKSTKPSRHKNIVFLGRLEKRKGCQLLLEALIHLKNDSRLKNTKVYICGKGPERQALERYTEIKGLSSIVKFTGFVTEAEKIKYLAKADVAVFPSLSGESFGIVLIEAMAAGASVVLAGDNPGYRSVMSPRPELLIDPRDTRTFAAKIETYLHDATKRESIKEWQKTYVKRFDVTVVGNQLLNIYTQVIAKRRDNLDNKN